MRVPRSVRSRSTAPRVLVVVLAAAGLLLSACQPVLPVPPPAAGAPPPPQPAAVLAVPGQALLGEPLTFSVSFDNTDVDDAGYGPYVDLTLPATGADGSGTALDDGLTFVSADYLGVPVSSQVLTFPPAGTLTHPLTGLAVTGTPGDQLVVLTLPFGSFTPTQPAVDIQVTAALSNLADVGTPLTIAAVGGFYLGDSPTGSTPIVQAPPDTAATTPTLISLAKTCACPEGETATGPNFPRSYTITADVADGQVVTDLRLTDLVPDSLSYQGVTGLSPAGSVVTEPAIGALGGTVEVRFPSVTGAAGSPDASFTIQFYVDRVDGGGGVVLDPATGAPVVVDNTAAGTYDWVPVDPRDPPAADAPVGPTAPASLVQRSLAVRKSVANVSGGDVGPGTVLEYTLDVEVSDYFAFDGVVLTDVISDGQSFDGTFTPTMRRIQHGSVLPSLGFDPGNYVVTAGPTTSVAFDVSAEVVSRGEPDGMLLGGCVPDGGTGGPPPSCPLFGPTSVRVVFRSVVDTTYSTGDPVIEGDALGDDAAVEGANLSTATLAPTGSTVSDGSDASVAIPDGTVSKSVYAVNGSTSFPDPPQVLPGDTVTYRLRFELPQSRHNGVTLEDYLPLPMFDAAELAAVSASAPSASAPTPGTVARGPSDTYTALAGSLPTLSVDPVGNSLALDYPAFAAVPPVASTIDLLFTVTASGQPFADGLLFTNQVRSTQTTTDGSTVEGDAIAQVERLEPLLGITKGVVATDASGTPAAAFTPATVGPVPFSAPGSAGTRFAGTVTSSGIAAQPIISDLTNTDAGDLVTFAVVVENAARGPAFDVQLRDALPAGMQIPAGGSGLNLTVTDGTGAPVAFSTIGSGLFDPAGGIALSDPGPTPTPAGVLDGCAKAAGSDPCLDTTGRNLVVLTFDLELTAAVEPAEVLTNTATLFRYQACVGTPGCVNVLDPTGSSPTTITDDATVTVRSPAPAKALRATSEGATSGTNLAVGEVARYRVEVRMPEGSATDLRVTDALPAGLAYLDDGTTTVAFVSSTGAGSFSSSTITPAAAGCSATDLNPVGDQATLASITPTCGLPAAAIDGGPFTGGTDPAFLLGDTTNTDSDGNQEFVVLELNAVVLNVAGNQANTALTNTVGVTVDGTQLAVSPATTIRVREPGGTLVKCLQSDPVTCASQTDPTADAGDTVAFRVVLTNPSGGNRTPEFDVVVTDVLDPARYTLNLGSVAISTSGSPTGVTDASAANTVSVTADSIPAGSGVTVEYTATVVSGIAAGTYADANTADATWTSLPGTNGTASNPTGSSTPGAPGTGTGERTGVDGPGGALNDYAATSSRDLVVPSSSAKTVIATSEADTGPVGGVDRVAIGEVVRYRLVSGFPEGTTPSVNLVDALPGGLAYLPGTARAALVSTGADMVSSTLCSPSCPVGLQVAGDETTVDSVTPTFALPATAVTGGPPWNGGTDPTFELGGVTNPDSDASTEYLVVEFNALVLNAHTGGNNNQAGTTRANRYTLRTGTTTLSTSNSVEVVVAEPSISFDKATDLVGPPDFNDSFNYEITISNGTGNDVSPAYDVHVTDAIPAELSQTGVPTCTPSGGAAACVHSGGNVVDETIAVLPPGGSVTITVPVVVTVAISPGQTVTNDAQATWTSLPGAAGTSPNPTGSSPPGSSGSQTGERDGTTAPGARNDYNAASTVPITIANAALTKDVADTDLPQTSGTDVVPGEAVTYDVGVTLPEGVTGAFTVTDAVPADMTFVPGTATLIVSGPPLANPVGGTITPAATFVTGGASSGAPVVFNFDGASLVGDNDATNDTFVIRYQVVVDEDVANTDGLDKTNTATISIPGTGSAQATVTVRRVDLAITKSDGGISVGPDQTIPYVLDYENTGGVGATGVVITETVPAGALYRTALSTPGWSCADGSPATTVCTFAVGTLGSGASGSVVFGLEPLPPYSAPFLVSNSVSIADDGASWDDANPADNVATDTTPELQAFDDVDATDVNTPKVVDVLTNDVGANPLIVTSSTPGQAGGTTVANGDGTITYTPPTDYTGYDVFEYTITDGLGGTDTATVLIVIDASHIRKNDRMFFTSIGGTAPCVAPCSPPGTYEQIQVAAPMPLRAQELVINLRDGFFPSPGDTFDVLTAPSVSGNWARVYGTFQYDRSTHRAIVFRVKILPDRVRLVATRSCVVTTTADAPDVTAGDGLCEDAQGRTTLRSAVMEAASGSLGSEVAISLPPTTYQLTLAGTGPDGGDLDLAAGTDIQGGGATIAASGTGDRVLELGGDNDLRDLTVTGGTAASGDGGGVLAAGSASLSGVTVAGNSAQTGGGIAAGSGSVTLERGAVTGNAAAGGGGGVAVSGAAVVADAVTVSGNTAGSGGGGAVLAGSFTGTSLTVAGNTAGGGGGLDVGSGATAGLTLTVVSANTADTGGGLAVAGSLSVTDSRVTGNTAGAGDGGGVLVPAGGSILATRVTFDANTASGAGGALWTGGFTTVLTSTVSGNGALEGAALAVDGGATTIAQTTITANGVSSGSVGSGAIQRLAGGTIGVGGSIVSDQAAGTTACGSGTTVTSSGYNHADDATCGMAGAGDVQTGSANLGPLKKNGGFGPTHVPNAGAPVVNSGDPTCTGIDQRLWARPRGGACDKGSVER